MRQAVEQECSELVGQEIDVDLDRHGDAIWVEHLPQELETVSIYSVDADLDTIEWTLDEDLGFDVVLGKAEVQAEVNFGGFIAKADYFTLPDDNDLSILDGDHNDHYMWVAVSRNVTLIFEVRIDTGSGYLEESEFHGVR